MTKQDERNAAAQSKAKAIFGKNKQQDADVAKARDSARDLEASKTARLRGLRLAKEACQEEVAPKKTAAQSRAQRPAAAS